MRTVDGGRNGRRRGPVAVAAGALALLALGTACTDVGPVAVDEGSVESEEGPPDPGDVVIAATRFDETVDATMERGGLHVLPTLPLQDRQLFVDATTERGGLHVVRINSTHLSGETRTEALLSTGSGPLTIAATRFDEHRDGSPQDGRSREARIRVSVGVDAVTSVVATFPDISAVPEPFLQGRAPSLVVGDGTPDEVLRDVLLRFAHRGVPRVTIEAADGRADLRLGADGAVAATFDLERLDLDLDLLDLERLDLEPRTDRDAPPDPRLSDLLPSSTVVLDVAEGAPVEWVETVRQALLRQGARSICIR